MVRAATDATPGVADARFSNDGVAWGSWTPYETTVPWALTAGDGTRTVYAQFRDGAGVLSAVTSDTIVVETVPPSGSISIAGGAAWTIDRNVGLTLSATDTRSGVKDVRISQDGVNFGPWLTYSTLIDWELPAGDGTRVVYAQFRDAAGNVSSVVSDTIGVDTRPPTGTVTISGGASASPTAAVTLALSATDALNGVAQMRLSNDGTNWSAWTNYATSADWTLAPGDGLRTVSAQFVDGLGNVSSATTDSIVVDTVAPTGAIVIEGDRPAVNSPVVSVGLEWSDGGAGVTDVRLSPDGATWAAWTAAKPSIRFTMEPGDGTRTLYAQFRDGAGNVSASASDTILIDTTAPTGTFKLAHDAAFVLPGATLTADTSVSDGPAGSGVAEFRSSADGGATWTDWVPIAEDGSAIVPRPADGSDRVVTIAGEVRDVAGNVAAVASDTTYLVDDRAPGVTLVSSFAGTVGLAADSDAVRVGLVAGDKLSLKLKVKALVRKADARVEIDVFGPDGAQLVTGRYPANAKTPGVANFPAPATGEYWIVIRAAGTAADTGVAYTMSVRDTPAKGARAKKGTGQLDAGAVPPSVAVSFDAADGLTLSGSLSGPVTPTPTLLAPDGSTVTVAVLPGPKGSQKLVALRLAGGTGTYVLTIPATGAVKYQLALTTGKLSKLVE
jgi:hypothetical protein